MARRKQEPLATNVIEVLITLPLPDPRLHAHAKGASWHSRAAAAKEARALACGVALQAIGKSNKPMLFSATISFRIFLGNKRRRDILNIIAGMKGPIDGLIDAGVIIADDWQTLHVGTVQCTVDASNPRVEITIEPRVELEVT